MIIEDIYNHLTGNSSVFTSSNLFVGGFRSDTGPQTAIYEYFALPPVRAFGTNEPVYERVRIQIITRSTSYPISRLINEKAYRLLEGIHNTSTFSTKGTRYVKIAAVQSPHFIGRDDGNRPQISTNLEVWKEWSTLTT